MIDGWQNHRREKYIAQHRLKWSTLEGLMLAHGEVRFDRRWCANCKKSHGSLYMCDSFTAEIKAEIVHSLARSIRGIVNNPAIFLP